MPRGKYDRKLSKINRLKEELAAQAEKMKALQAKLAGPDTTRRAMHTAVPQSVAPPKNVRDANESFMILRDNLVALTEVRQTLSHDGAVTDPRILAELDAEISVVVALLANCRRQVFGMVAPRPPAPPTRQSLGSPMIPIPVYPSNVPAMNLGG